MEKEIIKAGRQTGWKGIARKLKQEKEFNSPKQYPGTESSAPSREGVGEKANKLGDTFNLSKKKIDCIGGDNVYPEVDVKEFIKRRIYESTKLIALFNQGKLTSVDLREHRQNIKDDAGDDLNGNL